MSLHEYQNALELGANDPPFYALIMAAMLKADTDNATILRSVFSHTWNELQTRYHRPGGRLPEEEEGR